MEISLSVRLNPFGSLDAVAKKFLESTGIANCHSIQLNQKSAFHLRFIYIKKKIWA